MLIQPSTEVRNDPDDHAADLIGGGFFFAMRSCEYSKPAVAGKTKSIRLGGIRFYSKTGTLLQHNHSHLLRKSKYVWILFEDQKNGNRFDSRTQSTSGHALLCPVRCFARAVLRVRQFVPNADDNTLLSTINSRQYQGKFITNKYTLDLIRRTCDLWGGKKTFGFNPGDIGNRSIRSGAAMSLFLMNHSSDKIMILGRWKSDAFLDYIRPQVIEWTSCFSKDMVSFDTFFQLCRSKEKDGITYSRPQQRHCNLPTFQVRF
jgi:hypothetical protein